MESCKLLVLGGGGFRTGFAHTHQVWFQCASGMINEISYCYGHGVNCGLWLCHAGWLMEMCVLN